MPLATLDPKILIAVEDGAPRATAAFGILLRLGYTPVVTPMVLAALGRMAEGGGNPIERALAYETLQGIGASHSPYDLHEFTDVEKEVVRVHARRLMGSNAIPGGSMADARLIVEACYRDGRAVLVTRRTPILEANRGILDLALGECGLGAGNLGIFSPDTLIQYNAGIINRSQS